MDTITHALSGAVSARATAGSGPLSLRARVWAGTLAGAFPDADVVLAFFTDPLTFINLHRGVTHSLIMLPLWASFLAVAFAAIGRLFGRADGWRDYWGIAALAIAVHILGDVITSYGTQIFTPLSDYKAAFPTTFIIDPWFTGILLLGLLIAAWRGSVRPARYALLLLAGYIGFQAVLLERAVGIGERFARSEGLPGAEVHALPQPLSPFFWKVIVTQGDSYYVANIDLAGERSTRNRASPEDSFVARLSALYDPAPSVRWQRYDRFGDEAERLVREAWGEHLLDGYRRFAEFPVVYDVERQPNAGTCVWFVDLRFVLGNGELQGQRAPFRFGLCRPRATAAWNLFEFDGDGPKPVM